MTAQGGTYTYFEFLWVLFFFNVFSDTSKRTLAESFRIWSLLSVVGFGGGKKTPNPASLSLHSSSVSFSSQIFCNHEDSLCMFPFKWELKCSCNPIRCESWPRCSLETEDVISWTGAPVLREQRCVVDTSRSCSAVFPHSRNLCWVLLFFLLLSGSSEQLCRSALYQQVDWGTLGTFVTGTMHWVDWGSATLWTASVRLC